MQHELYGIHTANDNNYVTDNLTYRGCVFGDVNTAVHVTVFPGVMIIWAVPAEFIMYL